VTFRPLEVWTPAIWRHQPGAHDKDGPRLEPQLSEPVEEAEQPRTASAEGRSRIMNASYRSRTLQRREAQ